MRDIFKNIQNIFRTPKCFPADVICSLGVRQTFLESVPYYGKPTRIFACYSLPEGASKKHKVPGVVLIHGGGATALAEWCELWTRHGYAAISMDTRGRVPCWAPNPYNHPWPRHDAGGPPEQPAFDKAFEKPEDQWFYHAVTAAIVSHSFLRSFPEVNMERIGVSGISWGGVLSCVAAAVDPRFRFAVPVYGDGFWTDMESKLILSVKEKELRKWASLWEPKHYLSKITIPFFLLSGVNDPAFPTSSFFQTLDAVSGERRGLMRLNLLHDHCASWSEATVFDFVNLVMAGSKIPDPGRITRLNNVFSSKFSSDRKICRAALCYTRATGFQPDRLWHEEPADIRDTNVIAAVPWGATMAFFNLQDERGSVWSSTLWTLDEKPGNKRLIM